MNDLAPPATLAQLLRRDSVYGAFPGAVHADEGEGVLWVDGAPIIALSEPDPAALPWAALGVDVVIEATGALRRRAQAGAHLTAGARKVVVTAPVKDGADVTLVLGVNDDAYDPDHHALISNASCTTNCLAPLAKVLHETVGIRRGVMTTIHAYTGDQRLVDMPHKDLRRGRAAALNLVPTTTGAAPRRRLGAAGARRPARRLRRARARRDGSIVDLTFEAERPTSVQDLNDAVAARADAGALRGVLQYSEEPLVSSDVIGSSYSSIFDAPLDDRRRRHAGQGPRLVRQRVGLREPHRRPGAAGVPARHRREVIDASRPGAGGTPKGWSARWRQ